MVERSSVHYTLVWKHSLEESELPVQQYRHTVAEQSKEKMTKEVNEDVAIFSEKVKSKLLKFPVKMTVFHQQHGYLEIKRLGADGLY
jgi:hypothetical protein